MADVVEATEVIVIDTDDGAMGDAAEDKQTVREEEDLMKNGKVEEVVKEGAVEEEMLCCGKWKRAEMQQYFSMVADSVGMPIYSYFPEKDEDPMSVLVPPRLESIFCEHRERGSTLSPFPHAYLCRDWPAPPNVWDMSWWRNFFTVHEVEEAVEKRRRDDMGLLFNELHEHPQFGVSHSSVISGRQRRCDLAASFNRGRRCVRQFDLWMWGSFYSNPHDFPTLACLVNMVRIKQLLWNRYRFFYDVDVLNEVYCDNEIASWIRTAYENDGIAFPVYKDEELSYEVRNGFFSATAPRVRSYEKELEVQRIRRCWRYSDGKFFNGDVPYDSNLTRLIMEGEELPRVLYEADAAALRERTKIIEERRKPSEAQKEAAESDYRGWRLDYSDLELLSKSSEGTASTEKVGKDEAEDEFLLEF